MGAFGYALAEPMINAAVDTHHSPAGLTPAAHPQSPRRRPAGWCRVLRASVIEIAALPGPGLPAGGLGSQASQ